MEFIRTHQTLEDTSYSVVLTAAMLFLAQVASARGRGAATR